MAGARIHEASPNKTFIYTMAFGVMASWAGVGPALALSVLEQQRLYQDDYSNKAPGIYETPSSFIIIAEVRCGKNERSIDQKSRFRARKQLFALISRERQKRLRASLDGLQALHSELLLRRFNRKGPSRFVSLSLKSGRQIHCRYREVIAVEKNAFSDFENVNHIPLQKLEHDRIEYFRELIGSKKLNKLSSHYRQAGLIDLSIGRL